MIFRAPGEIDIRAAEIDIRAIDGRVSIQAFSNRMLGVMNWSREATPQQARQLARELLNAADAADRGGE